MIKKNAGAVINYYLNHIISLPYAGYVTYFFSGLIFKIAKISSFSQDEEMLAILEQT